MRERELAAVRRAQLTRDRLLAGVCRDLVVQVRWLRARLVEHHVRLRALDHLTPEVPPWPPIDIPPELRELLPPED